MPDAYADLAGLANDIGDARVVALGEPLHAVGNLDAYGAHLVSFLHEKLGFSVFAWEAGLWSCETNSAECIAWPWGAISDTREMRDLAPKLGMQVTGFDLQFTGRGSPAAQALLCADLARLVGPERAALSARLAPIFARLPKARRFRTMTIAERSSDRDVLLQVLRVAKPAVANVHDEVVVRGLENALRLYDWHEAVHADVSIDMDWAHHTELNNVRDQTMAENVMWLLTVRFPGQKIILWAANMHTARNVRAIEDLRGPEFATALSNYKTMGSWLEERLGHSYYSLAMTAFAGSVGNPPDDAIRSIEPASAGSIEATFLPDSSPVRFVSLARNHVARQKGRFLGLSDFSADWSAIFDGALVFRNVTPATQEVTARPMTSSSQPNPSAAGEAKDGGV